MEDLNSKNKNIKGADPLKVHKYRFGSRRFKLMSVLIRLMTEPCALGKPVYEIY